MVIALSPHTTAMLKITTTTKERKIRLILEGKLVSPWIAELITEWNEVRASARDLTVTVDMRNVTMISEEGEQLLFQMMSEGARFIAGGILNKYVLRKLARKLCEQRRRDMLP
jgi:hypothetical protein